MKPRNTERMDNYNPNLLHHIDLTAGYRAIHRIDTFVPHRVEECRALLPDGGLVPRVKGSFHVEIDGPFFTLFHTYYPILGAGIGRGRDCTWKRLLLLMKEYDYTLEADLHHGLWLAEVPLPRLYQLKIYYGWIFDFLRYLAAAMITSEKSKPV